MVFANINIPICGTETPSFLNLFDFSTAPSLLFYSYIPIAILSFLIGFFVYKKDNKSLKSKLLFWMTIFFVLWVLNILVQWIASYHTVLMFAWQLTAIFETGLFLTATYLAYVFMLHRDISRMGKLLFTGIMISVAVLLPTTFNIAAYDIGNCEGVVGPLWNILYTVEPLLIAYIAGIALYAFKKEKSVQHKKQITYFTLGIVTLLTTFFLSNIYGEFTGVYEFNLWGPVGMLIFFILLGYLMVRFHTFNIKMFATQALVLFIAVLISSKFFYKTNTIDIVLNAITLIFFVISGGFLIRSVRVEVEQKNRLQDLTIQLGQSNEKLKELDRLKTEFLSLASHQLRSPLTAIKGYASMLIEGSFGKLAVKTAEPIQRIYTSAQGLSNLVEDLLNVSKIEQGGMKYEFIQTDLADIVTKLYQEMQIPAQNKHISFELVMDSTTSFIAMVDPGKLRQVFLNLVDNSIKYTPEGGSVVISLTKKGADILYTVRDTGVGISSETKQKLFEKFSRGEAGKMNTGGSGLGLYLAQQITRAHSGEITIESEGTGKGTTFFVRIPTKN